MSKLDDIFYKNQMEHLIQDEPNYGFCETCQEMADFRCRRANKYLPYAKQQLKDLVLELAECDPPYKGDEVSADGWKEYNRKQYSMRDIDIAVESAFAGLRQKVNEL